MVVTIAITAYLCCPYKKQKKNSIFFLQFIRKINHLHKNEWTYIVFCKKQIIIIYILKKITCFIKKHFKIHFYFYYFSFEWIF